MSWIRLCDGMGFIREGVIVLSHHMAYSMPSNRAVPRRYLGIGGYAATNTVASQGRGGAHTTVVVMFLALANTGGQLHIRCWTKEMFLNQNEECKKHRSNHVLKNLPVSSQRLAQQDQSRFCRDYHVVN